MPFLTLTSALHKLSLMRIMSQLSLVAGALLAVTALLADRKSVV